MEKKREVAARGGSIVEEWVVAGDGSVAKEEGVGGGNNNHGVSVNLDSLISCLIIEYLIIIEFNLINKNTK